MEVLAESLDKNLENYPLLKFKIMSDIQEKWNQLTFDSQQTCQRIFESVP